MAVTNYNINFRVSGDNSNGSGNSSKTNVIPKTSVKNTQSLTMKNIKGAGKALASFQGIQAGNEILGSYTENRLRQRKINTRMTFAKYGLGIAYGGALGVAYMVGDLSYRGLMYNIDIQKKSREADYNKRLSGNNANSGSRYRGDYA